MNNLTRDNLGHLFFG